VITPLLAEPVRRYKPPGDRAAAAPGLGRVRRRDPGPHRPIHALIRGEADSEPFAVELRERLLHDRLANITTLVPRYAGTSLRPGMTIEQAGEQACALTSPEMRHLLINGLGWTPEQYTDWLCQLLVDDLLRLRPLHPTFAGVRGGDQGRVDGRGGGVAASRDTHSGSSRRPPHGEGRTAAPRGVAAPSRARSKDDVEQLP
jgi:hypothetical protein